jgi:L-malate glycosyltransferase
MKILFINYECPPLGGGGGVASLQIAQELGKTHEIDYLTTAFAPLPKFERINGVNVYRVPVLGRKSLDTATILSLLFFIPSSLVKGIKLCKKNHYDIINAHFVLPSGLTGIILAKLFSIPFVTSIHGGDIYDPTKKLSPHKIVIIRSLIKLILNRSDGIVAQSQNTKQNAIKYYGVTHEILIIPLGFVKPNFNILRRSDLNLPENHTLLISIGRLVKRKGFEYSLTALSQLLIKNKNISYIVIGTGPEADKLKKLVISLHIDKNVYFFGNVSEEEKYQYLSIADVYVLPSLHEGFGICLMEAMYSGLPIVTTDNGGQTDFLVDGKNGIFVPTHNSSKLSEKIWKLIEDANLRSTFSLNNRLKIKQYYIEEISKRYEELYRELIYSKQ